MKKILALVSLVISIQSLSASSIYEPFADATANGGSPYPLGAYLASVQTPSLTNATLGAWYGLSNTYPNTASIPVITNDPLTYTGFSASPGNDLFIPSGTGVMGRTTLPFVNSTTVSYYSFLIKVTDVSTVPTGTSTNFIAGFGDTTGGAHALLARAQAYLVTKKSGTGYVFGVGKNKPAIANVVYDTTVHNVGETVFIVVAYDYSTTGHPAELWINPSVSSFGASSAPTPTVSATTGTELSSPGIDAFLLGCYAGANTPACVVDDVRVTQSWAVATGAPDVQRGPNPMNASAGTTATFTVFATGDGSPTYQWYNSVGALSDNGHFGGTQTPTLTIANCTVSDDDNYYCIVSNTYGTANSATAALTVTAPDPAINSQPQNVTNIYGASAIYNIGATGNTALSYQWHRVGVGDLSDGGNVMGSQTASLTLSGISQADVGSYYVTVTDTAASVDSTQASLTVLEPAITNGPTSVTVTQGSNATFTVSAAGQAPFSYQWSKNGVALTDTGDFIGSQQQTLTISPVSAADAGTYRVLVTDGASMSTNSNSAVLTVLSPMSIAQQPSPLTLVGGNNATFAVGVAGTGPIYYQWYSNTAPIASATAFSYTITNAVIGMSGNFYVVATNSFSAVTSSIVPLSVVSKVHLYKTNLVVVRVGDGAQTQNFAGNTTYLDQYTTNGAYVNTVCIPDSGASSLIEMGPDVNGSVLTGTALSLSQDGLELVLSGYNTPRPFTGPLYNSTAAAAPRGVGMVSSQGHFILPVSDTNAFSGTYFRGAASDGLSNFWGAGNTGGVYYFGDSAAAGIISTNYPNLRSVDVFNGNLYGVSGSSTGLGIVQWSGVPTAPVDPVLIVLPGSTPTDMALDTTGSNMYLGTSAGIIKYTFDGATWDYQYTLTGAAIRYLTVDFTQNPPVIYATTSDSVSDRLLMIVDNGIGSAETVIAQAGVNQNLRGLRFGPAEPSFTFTHDASNIVLTWTGLYNLQSSTNVAGPYTNVPSATSPYTNAFSNARQLFFRLQQ